MFGIISHLLTAFGLASASGLNAYIPLLIVALTARFTNLIKLDPPFDILTNSWVIGLLVVLLLIETVVDKIPAADMVNNLFQTLVRPTAGALLFAASTNTIQLNPIVGAALGLILAFSIHTAKTVARPAITVGTAGLGNPVVSLLEDIGSTIISLLALLAPVLAALVAVVAVLLFFRWLGRRRPAATVG